VDRHPVPVAIALLLNRGRVFMLRRARDRPLAGQWEFPGGKVELDESPADALRRELREELGLAVEQHHLFGAYSHTYDLPDGPIHYVLLAYRADVGDGRWSQAGRWMAAEALRNARVVAGSRPIVADLLAAKLVARESRTRRKRTHK
jgi:8-oxo-dGTP diphosphatase